MSAPIPFPLTSATRFHPANLRHNSRSPSRSPLRKSQFAAREIDPLLSNLSPDSTLRALQLTATISGEHKGQDALARSIAEATPLERQIGIRAAVAGQKLKEWHQEVSRWPWPSRRDRGWGAGFFPPPAQQTTANPTGTSEKASYLGFLPATRVEEYQERIEDIRDGVEALELEEVKDHVFSAHVPQRAVSAPATSDILQSSSSQGYGRMRDFTALITATVVQALPELASLTALLDTWDVRLAILRQIPDVTQSFKASRAGIQTAFEVVRNPETGPLVTMEECEMTKNLLGSKVASLGAKLDKFLDMLEGQEDSLPKSWIDTVENLENEYAVWVVEAEHIAIRNSLLSKALAQQSPAEQKKLSTESDNANHEIHTKKIGDKVEAPTAPVTLADNPVRDSSTAKAPERTLSTESAPGRWLGRKSDASKKPPLSISLPSPGHNRGVSEISMADSTFSAMSDLSTAEIVDARSTKVLASPKISVVDNPFKGDRDEVSWMTGPGLSHIAEPRPPMLQRASTASIEVISRKAVKEVTLTRSRSHDMLRQTPSPSSASPRPGTPSQALQQLIGSKAQHPAPSELSNNEPDVRAVAEHDTASEVSSRLGSPTPSLRVQPLQVRSRESSGVILESPELPRRSSKRLSQTLSNEINQDIALTTTRTPIEMSFPGNATVTPVKEVQVPRETLEDKIKDILDTIPTKIRLAKESEGEESRLLQSSPSARSSTPVPSLTLSPVKHQRVSKQQAPGDIREFHLTTSGQSREVPPVKLFVRAVGEHGERVMVRVGGGWADLAEYLREYSLHHRHRGLGDGNLEVANFPASHSVQRDVSSSPISGPSPGRTPASSVSALSSTNRRSFPGTIPAPVELPAFQVNKLRKNGRSRPMEVMDTTMTTTWAQPPVPPIPSTFIFQSPTTVVTTTDGVTRTGTFEPLISVMGSGPNDTPVITNILSMPNGQASTTTSTTHNLVNAHANYTPLGAAGPRTGGRRVVSHNPSSNLDHETWVEDMVGKARAVSGTSTIIHGPTTTTTTTVISRSRPVGTRVSAYVSPSPGSSPGTASPDTTESKSSPSPARSKQRMSLGDVSGIKRVFLRKKSDRST